ncbi:MAG: hypothetical protein NPIRA06_07260 [Nitrospirales bacterium]|nr:MAG: hypothetical protein NPIRA06_07260 [Nitrospirales bacterium]
MLYLVEFFHRRLRELLTLEFFEKEAVGRTKFFSSFVRISMVFANFWKFEVVGMDDWVKPGFLMLGYQGFKRMSRTT